MIFWPFCAFIWFKNIEKMLLQMTSGFLQLESTLGIQKVRYATCYSLVWPTVENNIGKTTKRVQR
jgi:hypothetical protein